MPSLSRVLVPVDLRSAAWDALEYAGELAKQYGAVTDLLYVAPKTKRLRRDGDARAALLFILASLTEQFAVCAGDELTGPDPIFVGTIQPGDPTDVILNVAASGAHDLIVMGTHGRTGLSHLVHGSVAEAVVRRARSPVLVVPSVRME